MNNYKNKQINEFGFFHLAILGIFFLALFVRIYGAININITNLEAKDLLALNNIESTGLNSFFYNLILKTVMVFGIESNLALRLINLFLGSLIILLPLLFLKEIGKKATILSAVFFAIDPFGIVNSVIFTGNILTIFITLLLIESLIHQRKNFIKLLLILFIGHDRGLGYLISISLLFLITILLFNRQLLKNFKLFFTENIFSKNILLDSGVSLFLIVGLSVITKIPASRLISDIANFAIGWSKNYQIGNYPIVFPFAIISYIPFALIVSFLFIFSKPRVDFQNIKLVLLWIVIAFFIITFNPGHLYVDLIWVSLPMWFITAVVIGQYLPSINSLDKENLLYFGILFAIFVNLILNIFTLVYRSIWGIDITNPLLSTLFVLIFIIVLLVYKAYTSTVKISLSSFFLVIFLFFMVFQFSILSRTTGMNQKPEKELFWNGYFDDQDVVNNIISTTKANILGTFGQLNIFFDGQTSASEIWALHKDNLFFLRGDIQSNNPDVIISSGAITTESNGAYQGEEFISNSFPLWTLDPISSLFSTDYLNWLIFRNGQQYKEYNAIWLNKTTLVKHSLIGDQ